MGPYRGIQIGHDEAGYYFIWLLSDGTVIDLGFFDSLEGGLMHIIEVESLPDGVRQAVIEIREMARFCRWRFADTALLMEKISELSPRSEDVEASLELKPNGRLLRSREVLPGLHGPQFIF